jgi:hypothetical protein
MQFPVISLSFIAFLSLPVYAATDPTAEIAQINYYWDQYCKDFYTNVTITQQDDNWCFDYYIAGAGSMDIANAYGLDSLSCWWHTDIGCADVPGFISTFSYNSQSSNCVSTGETRVEPVAFVCSNYF